MSDRLEATAATRPDPDSGAGAAGARAHVSDEQIHSSACGSAIEINYDDDDTHPVVVPFFAEWAFGSRPGGRAVNLSVGGKGLLGYSSAHAVVLYDYKSHSQRLLLGHKNTVVAMAADASGSWLVSVDGGSKLEPSAVIVWDLSSASLSRVLPGEPPPQGYRTVSMSHDGDLVVAGAGRLLQLWRWKDDKATVVELPEHLGAVNAVSFNQDAPGCLMVTCDKNVAFLAWSGGDGGGGPHVQPGQLVTRCPGRLVDSVFLRGTTNAVSVSDKGFVVLWSDPPIYAPSTKVSRRVYCIEKDGLTALAEVDGMVVIGTSRGHIRFYDQDMCLLHWYQQAALDAVTGLSFNLDPPGAADGDLDLAWASSRSSFPTVRHSVDAERRGVQARLDLSRLISGPSPRQLDAEDPFQARDLIVSTAGGRLVLVSFVNQRCVVLQDHQDAVTALQTHPERSALLLGRANGSVSMIDYATKEVMVTFTFDRKPGAEPISVTSLSFSPNGTVLACGRANGSLLLLHPALLHPVTAHPFHKTRAAIHHLCFSPDNMFMAHSDGANFVSAYRWLTGHRWAYLGKKELHSLPVRGLLFGPQPFDAPLFSFGEDHVLVEYDVAHSLNNTLLVTRLDRIERSGVPSSVSWCPGAGDGADPVLIISTSEFKYRLVDLKTRKVCGTAQGPRLHTTVSTIHTIGGPAATAPATAVYATQRRLGLQCLPPDGNPFKNVAMIVHPVKITSFVVSPCEEFVFTCGAHDHSVLMWRINQAAVDTLHAEDEQPPQQLELDPWLLSVEGGREGWLVQTMRDMFCYAQMLHQGTLSTEPRYITDMLPVCELPDVMRALGFFPSQSQIDTMVSEVLQRCGETLTSSDLVKLYVNHKPVFGMAMAQLREAFNAFAYPVEGTDETAMTKDKFLSILLDRGEALDASEAQSVLRVLLPTDMDTEAEGPEGQGQGQHSHLLMDDAARREKFFYFLPETITFDYFVSTLLGIVKK